MRSKITSRGGTRLFILCFLAYAFSYFGRYNFSACMNSMIGQGLFDLNFGGYISSAYLICYGAGQFINGWLGVRVSPKVMIAVGLFGAGCANILMGCAGNRFLLLIIWALNGFFNSMLWSPIIRAFTDWMEEPERVRAGANISPTIPVGMLGSYLISSFVLRYFNWRVVFFVCGGLICLAGLIWITGISSIRGHLASVSAKKSEELAAQDSGGAPAKRAALTLGIFFGTGLIFVAAAAVFNGSLKDAVISWTQQYLIQSFGFSDSSASLVSTFLPAFSVSGPYIAVWIDRRYFHNECTSAAVMFAVSAVSLLGIVLIAGKLPIVAVILLSISMSCMWGINTLLLTFIPYHYGRIGISSAVTGTLNCFAYIGSSACAGIYGNVASGAGWGVTVILWMVMAACGTTVCIVASPFWKKRRPAYD